MSKMFFSGGENVTKKKKIEQFTLRQNDVRFGEIQKLYG